MKTLYVLDTDILTLFRQGHPQVVSRVGQHSPARLAASIISVEEQMTGWYAEIRQAKNPAQAARAYEQLALTVKFFAVTTLLPYTEMDMARFEQLLRLKLNVGKNDLRIAAIALENNAVVVTRNGRDFGRVPDLVIEDWTLPNA